jgi:hypothetical protein
MITKDQAVNLKYREELHFGECQRIVSPHGVVKLKIVRVRVFGRTKTWVRSPERFQVPIKHGLYEGGYINEGNAQNFHLPSECPLLEKPQLPEKLRLKDVSPEMRKRIIRAMGSTWDAIGGDTLQCVEDCGGKTPIPRSHVIEMVCDADRMAMYGNDRETYEMTKKLSYDDLKKLGKEAFPYKRYGW